MDPNRLPGRPLQGPPDLSNCDREPIHIPAGIQSFGAMIVARMSDQVVVSVSENLGDWFDPEQTPVVGNSITEACPDWTALINEVLASDEGHAVRHRMDGVAASRVVATGHHCDGLLIVELESADLDTGPISTGLIESLFAGVESKNVQEVYDRVVMAVKRFTGFDRVMLYEFLEDDHGCVVAEAKQEDQETFLGLHYPASDIPAPARRLYELKWVRTVADVHAAPVVMKPDLVMLDAQTEAVPINMAYSDLRAISPIHLEYLRNMGVGASMSISILNGGRLWGLIACHHRQPKVVAPMDRQACELAGSLLSTYLTSRRQQTLLQQRVDINESISEEISKLANQDHTGEAIVEAAPWLAKIVSADGVVWAEAQDRFYWGETPTESQTTELLAALDQLAREPILYTDSVVSWHKVARPFAERLPGLMALRMGQRLGGVLLFFRKPYANSIDWAGNPDKSETDESGRLTPRKSFEKFTQSVDNRSRPWSAGDRETAELLLTVLNSMIVEQASRLARVNEELRRLNTDLDAFAYAASHDLKEPLRGIHHHVFMLEQAESLAGPAFERGMVSLKRLVSRMSELLDGLLRFSRAGRQELNWETFLLSDIVSQAKDIVFGGLPPDDVEVEVIEDGPISGDFACVREILSNLISNSIKYNAQDRKRIELKVVASKRTPFARFSEYQANVISVRDNGIGIAKEYQNQIFEIFTRLHGSDEYGGGSGAGLTIARRMVERHGGRIAVESDGVSGSTFYLGWEPA